MKETSGVKRVWQRIKKFFQFELSFGRSAFSNYHQQVQKDFDNLDVEWIQILHKLVEAENKEREKYLAEREEWARKLRL